MTNRKTIIITLAAEDGHMIFQKELSMKLVNKILGSKNTLNPFSDEFNWKLIDGIKTAAYLYMDSFDVCDADLRIINNFSGTVNGMWLHR